jgi:NAD+ synthase (glutamine-hydrolysing)
MAAAVSQAASGPPPLHPELQAKLAAYRAARAFDVEDWVEKKCAMLNDYMKKCKLSACVISISGGVDSAVTLGLCKRAAGMPESPIKRILGVCQPIHSSVS